MVEALPAVTFPPVVSSAVEEAANAFFCGSCGMTQVPDLVLDGDDGAGIMSTISFMGDFPWAFAMAFPEDAAVTTAKSFAGFEIPFDSPDMGDVVGEIVNVIAGDVVGRLAKKGIRAQMSLPTTVRGNQVAMLVPSDAPAMRFAFSGPNGTCCFDLVATSTTELRSPAEPEPTPAPVNRAEPVKNDAPAAPKTAAEEALAAWAAAEAEAERQLAEQGAANAARHEANGGALPAQPVQPTTTVAAPTGTVRAPRHRFLYLAIVFACGGWGAAAGLLVTGKRHAAPAPVAPAPSAHKAEPKVTPQDPSTHIDTLIRSNRFAEALQKCLDAPKNAPGLSETALALREGLCLEGMGRWVEAAGAYETAEADPNMAVWTVAMLGQARCATQEESYGIARTITNRVLLRSAHPNCRGLKVREEVEHLRTRIDLLQSGSAPLPRDATARALLSKSPCNGLDWLSAPAAPAAAPGKDVFEVHRALGAPGALQVTAALSARPVIATLRSLASTAGWKVQASDRVVALLNREVGPLEVDHLPVNEFLGTLMAGTEITWAVQGDTLILTPRK